MRVNLTTVMMLSIVTYSRLLIEGGDSKGLGYKLQYTEINELGITGAKSISVTTDPMLKS